MPFICLLWTLTISIVPICAGKILTQKVKQIHFEGEIMVVAPIRGGALPEEWATRGQLWGWLDICFLHSNHVLRAPAAIPP